MSDCIPIENFVGIGTVPVSVAIHQMDLATLCENPEIRVGQPAGELPQSVFADFPKFRVA